MTRIRFEGSRADQPASQPGPPGSPAGPILPRYDARVAIPSPREAIRILDEGHTAVRRLVEGLSVDEWLRPNVIGGDWSAKDLLAHLAEWERYALQALAEWRRGERPWVESLFEAGAVDQQNAEAVARSRERTLEEVRAGAEEVHRDLLLALELVPEEGWRSKAPYPTTRRTTLGALLAAVLGAPRRPFGHAYAHLPDLEAYVASLRTRA